jgi:flagellar P-ring protein precursor FlgI
MARNEARRTGLRAVALVMLAAAAAAALPADAARVKDITAIEGIRANQLYGFGLVFGLAGTGSGGDFAAQIVQNMLEKLRVGRGLPKVDAANVAAVIVTADLPPFARQGSTIDVTVSALDEATSLRGGTLVLTPLVGADGNVYAVAQGAVSVGGFAFGGAAATVQQGHATVGRIPGGAIVEREVETTFLQDGVVTLCLMQPDFATATRISAAVDANTRARATVLDAGTVRLTLPRTLSTDESMQLISDVQMLEVMPDAPAIVVINERTGTVVAGQNVSISLVAISHGNLTVVTQELPEVVQPLPFAAGTTETVPRTALSIIESPLPGQQSGLTVINHGATVSDVARALNLLGASPRDIISIFQAMKEAGALHAELRVM